MSVTADIVATYRGPGRVMQRLLAMGQREDRALALIMAACLIAFVAQMPGLAREAHLAGTELNPLLGSRLLGSVIFAPLAFYGLAALSHIVARLFGGRGDWYGARLALFWALVAVSPLVLVQGLIAGFIGAGPLLTAFGVLGFAVFLWFWFSCLRQAERRSA